MFSLSRNFVSGEVIVPLGEVDIELYVVALDGVAGHGVGNISRTVEGVLSASHVNAAHCWLTPLFELKFGEIEIKANATVIHDWDAYKEVVETCSNSIIVNAHGETVPVPTGYTKEEWVDRIAEAMTYRNVTWVHTAGYPFYYYHDQAIGEGEWKEEGFQRLMSHIGKNNVTCHYTGIYSSSHLYDMNLAADVSIFPDWSGLYNAQRVQIGKPLKSSDFKDVLILPIWGSEDDYMMGAIIKFANTLETRGFGFYVHIGTYKTYNSSALSSDYPPTDSDYWRGFAGAAAAIWANAWRFAAEDAISEAEAAIAKAENEGRTKGLDEAKQLLQQAKSYFEMNHWITALLEAIEARSSADNVVKPSFVEGYVLPLTIFCVASAITATSLAIIWKRNSKKRGSETQWKNT